MMGLPASDRSCRFYLLDHLVRESPRGLCDGLETICGALSRCQSGEQSTMWTRQPCVQPTGKSLWNQPRKLQSGRAETGTPDWLEHWAMIEHMALNIHLGGTHDTEPLLVWTRGRDREHGMKHMPLRNTGLQQKINKQTKNTWE